MRVTHITFAAVACLIATAELTHAATLRTQQAVAPRPAGQPLIAVVSLRDQQITVYDDKGWIMRARVSSGQKGRETPAGIFSVLQKDADHYSNMYDDAYMPHMQRLTWSGIALHGGVLPGYPASHGCVRMPYEFAGRLFDMTKLGLRVIVAPRDTVPITIDHPALFQPKTGAAAAAATAATAAAEEATRKGDRARLVSIAAYREWAQAMAPVRKLQIVKLKAEWELSVADRAIASAPSPEAKQQSEDVKAKLSAQIGELQTELAARKAELQPKLDAVTSAREAVTAAEREQVLAEEAARKAVRDLAPVSVFISRKTQRLYVRQAFQPILDVPVTIQDADRPMGTHIFTSMERTSTGIRWSAVSLVDGRSETSTRHLNAPVRSADRAVAMIGSEGAKAALERIVIPQDIRDFIEERISPPSSLIISDEPLSSETGTQTEFVVLLSGEPQGGIKSRRSSPRIGLGYGQY